MSRDHAWAGGDGGELATVASSGIIHAISGGSAHTIYTRFVHRGGGKIANPVNGDGAARVALHLSGTKVVGHHPVQREYFYQVSVVVKDASGKLLWSGEMWVHWQGRLGKGKISHRMPNIAKRLADNRAGDKEVP